MTDKEKKDIKQLFNQVRTISKTYDLIAKNTGENFNIFQILGMETAEVKTHSKFLAELLNPNGSHLQGDTFLKLFVKYLNDLIVDNEKPIKLDYNSSTNVFIEKHIGKKTDTEGGRIDITIEEGKKHLICIENKIYAGEQDKQMLRYSNFGNTFETKHLFFLTLWGNETNTNGDAKVYPISYKTHIVEWLELCKKEAVNLPILRESIGQYINLIKKLTHQTSNKNMANDLQKIILENYDESSLIYENFTQSVFNLYNNVIRNLVEKVQLYLQNSEWEISRVGEIKSINDRGLLFIKPKNSVIQHGFGIEEFNPLCKYHHFNHRIFYGITNWNQDTKFLEIAKNINKSNVRGGWINYDFPKSERFDFSLSTNLLIKSLLKESQQLEFVEDIFESFKEYFEKNQKEYLEYLKM